MELFSPLSFDVATADDSQAIPVDERECFMAKSLALTLG
jgi:hypothetical protein